MNKKLVSMAVGAALAVGTAGAQADVQTKWFGFAQITGGMGGGLASDPDVSDDDGLRFGADRVRIGFKLKDGPVFGKLQVDFNAGNGFSGSTDDGNTLSAGIKDVEAGYKFSNMASVKVGQFKTPVGMDFNTSGKKLDITKRGMEKRLVLERAVGVMLSGRDIGMGLGYDLFYGNPSTRSNAVGGGVNGDDATWAVRGLFDMGDMAHFQASYGQSEQAGGGTAAGASTGEDYTVWDVGVSVSQGPITGKLEYIAGSDVGGTDGADQTAWFVHGGFMLNRSVELVARHYQSDYEDDTGVDTDLSNTYLGANFFLGSSKTNGRVQVNYVLTGGDDGAGSAYRASDAAGSTSGTTYVDDVLLAQYQMSF